MNDLEAPLYTVVIIGSGFGGQTAAINLLKQGVDDFIMLERRSFAGGTWKQNAYPGAAVDVQSPLYSLSFEPYDWTRLYAEQPELEAYTQHIFNKYQLKNKLRCNANVTEIRWNDVDKHWTVKLNNQEHIKTRFVINATGPLSQPVTPPFKGLDSFAGASFHTNQWDHQVELHNKRVAIIGSGASAAQVIPAIVDSVKTLHVFQRTPHWVIPRKDVTFKPWQRWLLKFKPVAYLLRWFIYWMLEFRIIGFKYSTRLLESIGTRPAKRHLNRQVKDPDLRQKLTPDFTIGCKRVIISNTLYPALTNTNTVFHDKYDGVSEITPTGIITQKNDSIDLDVIIYATGFDATDGLISYPVFGKNGAKLSDFWRDYPRAYLGTSVPEFPNLFIVTGPNTGIGHTSALFVIESQMKYIMKAIKIVLGSKSNAIEVTRDAEARYTSMVHREMQSTVWHTGGCQSWYKSKSGKVIAMFPGFSFSYRRLCSRFRKNDHFTS
ncbi:flavin-containing monooxygenase [Alteromonas facilis]|uniref:flavin-containing monooxygenase n=1 Tax=Alteromonas facilis TaxID=2048004 RepID=UPI000C286F87|nr:NAD(P)/FAD-dependent oxidoreductase [Alteromonas facilis]